MSKLEKKAVITILGLVGHTKKKPIIENDKIIDTYPPKDDSDKALYSYDSELSKKFALKQDYYFNMLPLILENFDDYEKVCIYTKLSLKIQSKLLNYEEIDFDIKKDGFFVSEDVAEKEAGFSYFLNGINQKIEQYDSVIVDVTHGFRHFPILAIINLIMQNIKNPKKIESIIFAKEIKQFKKYEIINLKKYLELANVSYMLSTFNQNYTVSNYIEFDEKSSYLKLANELREFSNHFLSNSLKPLIEGEIIDNILENLKDLKDEKDIINFSSLIEEIELHLREIKTLKNEKAYYKRLHRLSTFMNKRGYQLNAITLLFEAVGFYCADRLSLISSEISDHIEYFVEKLMDRRKPATQFSQYTLVNQSRIIVKLTNRFNGDYLFNPETITWDKKRVKEAKQNKKLPTKKSGIIKNEINEYILKIDGIKSFQSFIINLEDMRNNLAHGNSSNEILNVQEKYDDNLKLFENFCITQDILKRKIVSHI